MTSARTDSAPAGAFDEGEICQLISDILATREVAPLKTGIELLLRHLKNVDGMRGWVIQNRFRNAITKRDGAYQSRTHGLKYNAVIILPELALTAMIPAYVPLTGNHYEFVDGLNRFMDHCDGFVSPIYPAITETEIRTTLSAAQRAFGMIDIIAPNYPLRIHRFDYSHNTANSTCGVLSSESRQSVVFLYHPRESEIYDRVFIFAHELGHALHFALTGDIKVFPEGFDSFNEKFGVKFETMQTKQEGFADAVAIAILSSLNSKLKSHLPTRFCKDISPVFVRYFEGLCNSTVSHARTLV